MPLESYLIQNKISSIQILSYLKLQIKNREFDFFLLPMKLVFLLFQQFKNSKSIKITFTLSSDNVDQRKLKVK